MSFHLALLFLLWRALSEQPEQPPPRPRPMTRAGTHWKGERTEPRVVKR